MAQVLVLGASGVVGTPIIEVLSDHHDVIAAGHRRVPVTGRVVELDVTQPMCGLDPAAYAELCSDVDVIVNSAAIANFSADKAEVDSVNVEGLGRVVELAAEAEATLIHVSTAFVSRYGEHTVARLQEPKTSARPDEYVASKYRGEQIIRDSGIDAVIVRPSVIIGDSQTGVIREHQAVHQLTEGLLLGTFPFIPAGDNALLDVIPQDVVARFVGAVIDQGIRSGELWITTGHNALSIERFLELVSEVGLAQGVEVPNLRIVDPSIVDRLIRPVFEDSLGERDLKRMDTSVAICDLVMFDEEFPSSLGAIPGGPGAMSVDAIEQAWRSSIRRLISELRLDATR